MQRQSMLRTASYFFALCFLSISMLVFVNATSSFILTDIIGTHHQIGDKVGTLGFADELVAIFACPIWGALSDRAGTHTIAFIGYVIISVALICLVNAYNYLPNLLLYRLLFSMGGSAVSTMVTAVLPSIDTSIAAYRHSSDTGTTSLCTSETVTPMQPANRTFRTHRTSSHPHDDTEIGSGSFRNAGFVGLAAGCGALLAVFGFLRLPARLQEAHLAANEALQTTYYTVSFISLSAAILCFVGLREEVIDDVTRKDWVKRKDSLFLMRNIKASMVAAWNDDAVSLAYMGGFVARASSVGISLFIPLWINTFFIRIGICHNGDVSGIDQQCREAYVLASILTGVSQLAALLAAPLYGLISARYHYYRGSLILSALFGIFGYTALCTIQDPRFGKHRAGSSVLVWSALIGLSQIGAIVCSLGLLSQAIVRNTILEEQNLNQSQPSDTRSSNNMMLSNETVNGECVYTEVSGLIAKETNANVASQDLKGAVAGTYSFIGGIGILILTKIGGYLFDRYSLKGPFILLASFNGVLFALTIKNIILRRSE